MCANCTGTITILLQRVTSSSSVGGGVLLSGDPAMVVWWVSCALCRDYFLVVIHFIHIQLRDCVMYLVWVHYALCGLFGFFSIQKVKTKIILVVNSGVLNQSFNTYRP